MTDAAPVLPPTPTDHALAPAPPEPPSCWAVVFHRNREVVLRAVSSEKEDADAIWHVMHDRWPELMPKIYECKNAAAAVALRDLICGEIEEKYAAAFRRLAAVPDPT